MGSRTQPRTPQRDNAPMSNAPSLPAGIPLGRDIAYPTAYDPGLLFPIARAPARAELGLAAGPLLFIGHDRWHAYEIGWLDGNGKPRVATATFWVPADSPQLIESKSFKLYLNSLNAHRLDGEQALCSLLEADLSRAAGAPVAMAFGLPPVAPQPEPGATCIDDAKIAIDHYGPPDAACLQADRQHEASETLLSYLLKSNCPVTGQPDWASVRIAYAGPHIDHDGLLRYLVGFREHAGFHEQCVERIFCDVLDRCGPRRLSVEARYTRRGGLDINPWRATAGYAPPPPLRDARQ